jgi:hypothetical protein
MFLVLEKERTLDSKDLICSSSVEFDAHLKSQQRELLFRPYTLAHNHPRKNCVSEPKRRTRDVADTKGLVSLS